MNARLAQMTTLAADGCDAASSQVVRPFIVVAPEKYETEMAPSTFRTRRKSMDSWITLNARMASAHNCPSHIPGLRPCPSTDD